MIAHLVLMRLHNPDDAGLVAAQVLSLRGRVPGLAGIEGGPTVISTPSSWELGFVMVFTDRESTLTYQDHPVHVEIATVIRPLIQAMATCDVSTTRDALEAVVGAAA
jgi:hypothetical protein